MTWVAAAVVGSAVVGGIVSSDASRKASNTQRDAANLASQTQLESEDRARADQKPWLDTGKNALGVLGGRLGLDGGSGDLLRQFSPSDFQQDPGYQFRLDQGNKAITNSAAARGGLLSGAAVKAASQYNQDMGSQEYQNAFNRFNTNQTNQYNRLASLAGVGQVAANQNSSNAMQTGNIIGQNQIGAGNARASGYIGQGNAITGAIGQGLNMYQQNQMLNKMDGTNNGFSGYGSGFTQNSANAPAEGSSNFVGPTNY